MTTSIQSKNSTQSAILVNGVEAAVFDAGGISGIAGINGGQLAGMRNRIINGGMQVNQRELTSLAISALSSFLVDRYSYSNSVAGSTLTASTSTITYDGVAKPSLRLTSIVPPALLTGTNYWHGLTQAIEGYNIADLKGKTITVSFLFLSNVTGNINFALRDNSSTNSYVTTFACVAGVTQQVSITVALPASLSIPYSNASGLSVTIGFLNTGAYQTSTLNAWQSGNYVSASGATNWGATAGNYIDITELQLELGSVATPFEHRPYGLELALCQRYYQTHSYDTPLGCYNGVNQFTCAIYNLPVTMRTNPTVPPALTSIPRFWTLWANIAVSAEVINTFEAISSSKSSITFKNIRVAGANSPVGGSTYTYEGSFSFTASAEL